MGRAQNVLVLLLVAAAGLATAQDVTYIPERQTDCWTCHVDDPKPPTPMRSVWNIIPPGEVAVPAEDILEYTVAIQNGWYHEVRYLEIAIDIAAAPSLKFFDGRVPVEKTFEGLIERPEPQVGPPTPPELLPPRDWLTDPARGSTVVHVPPGATSLRLEMGTTDANFQPRATWSIYKEGGTEPSFGPFATGPGERFVFTRDSPADFEGVGYGNWTIEAQVTPVTEDGQPNPMGTRLPFEVDLQARFDASEETVSIQSRALLLKPFETTLFTWDMQAVGTPGVDEFLRIEARGTAHWKHQSSSNAIDWENITKAIEIAIRDDGGTPVITPSSDLLITIVPEVGASASIITVSEAVGYASAFLLFSSIWSGGVFGRGSRRRLNTLFGTARRRVAFHNFLSYGLTAAALAHAGLFLVTAFTGGPYNWTLGVIWGGLGILAMFGLGVTGAMQVQLIRRWDYATWKWTHFALAMAAIAFTLLHMLLDGAHFGAVQDALGWQDPLDFRPEAG